MTSIIHRHRAVIDIIPVRAGIIDRVGTETIRICVRLGLTRKTTIEGRGPRGPDQRYLTVILKVIQVRMMTRMLLMMIDTVVIATGRAGPVGIVTEMITKDIIAAVDTVLPPPTQTRTRMQTRADTTDSPPHLTRKIPTPAATRLLPPILTSKLALRFQWRLMASLSTHALTVELYSQAKVPPWHPTSKTASVFLVVERSA